LAGESTVAGYASLAWGLLLDSYEEEVWEEVEVFSIGIDRI